MEYLYEDDAFEPENKSGRETVTVKATDTSPRQASNPPSDVRDDHKDRARNAAGLAAPSTISG